MQARVDQIRAAIGVGKGHKSQRKLRLFAQRAANKGAQLELRKLTRTVRAEFALHLRNAHCSRLQICFISLTEHARAEKSSVVAAAPTGESIFPHLIRDIPALAQQPTI